MLAALAAVVFVSVPPLRAATEQVRIASGMLQGSVEGGVSSFKGIPYAAPPIGNLRWRPPQHLSPWTGVRQATAEAVNAYWVAFAKTGSPNSDGRPEWPACQGACDAVLDFGNDGVRVVTDPLKARLDLTAAVADQAR